MHPLDLIGFLSVLGLLIASAAARAQGDEAFLVAERRLPLFPLVATS